jgi:hypothetical protein
VEYYFPPSYQNTDLLYHVYEKSRNRIPNSDQMLTDVLPLYYQVPAGQIPNSDLSSSARISTRRVSRTALLRSIMPASLKPPSHANVGVRQNWPHPGKSRRSFTLRLFRAGMILDCRLPRLNGWLLLRRRRPQRTRWRPGLETGGLFRERKI